MCNPKRARHCDRELTIEEVAVILKAAPRVVLSLIHQKRLRAIQACRNAPWTIRQADLDEYMVAKAAKSPSTPDPDQLNLDIQ
jgi:excisionase family DNA binding protein